MAYRALHTIFLAGSKEPVLAGEPFTASEKVADELIKDGAAEEFDADAVELTESGNGLYGRTAEFLYDLADEAGLVLEQGLDAVAIREIIIAAIAARDDGNDLLDDLPPVGGDLGEPKLKTIKVGDEELPVPAGYAVEAGESGWHTITGPEGFEPRKAQGAAKLKAALADLPPVDADGAEAPPPA